MVHKFAVRLVESQRIALDFVLIEEYRVDMRIKGDVCAVLHVDSVIQTLLGRVPSAL